MPITHKEYIIQNKKYIELFKSILIIFCLIESIIFIFILSKSYFALIYFSIFLGIIFFKKPMWGIYFLLAILPFFANSPGGKHHLYFLDLIMIIMILRWFFSLLSQPLIRLKKTPIDLYIFIIYFFAILSLLPSLKQIGLEFKNSQNLIDFIWRVFNSSVSEKLYSLRAIHNLTLIILLYFFLINNLNGLNQIKRLSGALLSGLFLSVFIGIFDFYNIISINFFRPPTTQINGISISGGLRFQSLFWHPNWFAQFLSLTSPFYFAILIFSVFRKKWYHFFLGYLLFHSIIFTHQRGGWIVFLLSFLFLLVVKKSNWLEFFRKKFVRTFIAISGTTIFLVIFCGLLLLKANHSSLPSKLAQTLKFKDRSEIWLSASALYLISPIYGAGIGNYACAHKFLLCPIDIFPHPETTTALNTFLQILVETGPITLITFIVILTYYFTLGMRTFLKTEPRDPKRKYIVGSIAFLFGFSIYSMFQYLFLLRINEILFWVVLSMLFFLTKENVSEIYFFKNKIYKKLFLITLLIFILLRFFT